MIISAAGEVADVKKTTNAVLQPKDSVLIYVDFSDGKLELGGSAFAQMLNRVGVVAPEPAEAGKFVATFNAVQSLVEKGQILAMHDVSAGGLVTTLLEMAFSNTQGGVSLDTSAFGADCDLVKVLFAENPAVVMQIAKSQVAKVEATLAAAGASFKLVGEPTQERTLEVHHAGHDYMFFIDHLRDLWYSTSYLLDRKQSGEACAKSRFLNYKQQPLRFHILPTFTGKASSLGIEGTKHAKSGIKAAIIREKGVNGDREMAYSLYYAGFDVKDVHMTDLMSGRETLEDVNMIVFCGGFSNSDVLGSAKGWASGFVWNENAKRALKNFYSRPDTLSLGICNGCQLMIELNLINPEHKERMRMLHNDSHKFESQYLGVTIPENNSVMFGSLSGSKLGIWVAHGEGKFHMPESMDKYNVVARYNYDEYPGNPNGSPMAVAGVASADGRHLAMMPHLERVIFPWQCPHYPAQHRNDEVTPWVEAFVNARKWVEKVKGK